jgi:hypothetical protein
MRKNIVVWFSCGAASAVAAKLTIDKYKDDKVMVVNSPVDEEDEDNRRFLKDVEKWLGQEIILATNTKAGTTSCVDIWNKRRYMGGINGAPCTQVLKKGARYEFELKHEIDWHVLGFTYDEMDRHERFVAGERENLLPVLIDAKITKGRCFEILREAGIKLPRVYKLGYPNANCIGCVKATSPTYWNHVRKMHPEVFEHRAKQSREIGARLVRVDGERIFLDELNANAFGGKMNNFDCGIFCDIY